MLLSKTYLFILPLQHCLYNGFSETGDAFIDALKINESLTQFEVDKICSTMGPYRYNCILESEFTSEAPCYFPEMKSVLARNARTQEEKRFKRSKLAAQHL